MSTAPAKTQNPASVGEFVASKIVALQEQYLQANRSGQSDARLARLRRAVTVEAGADPEVWSDTLDGVPFPGKTDVPSATERAAHTALTLYALHQQSQRERAHRPGGSLGSSVRALAISRDALTDSDRESAVRRRFDALMTANSYAEIVYHLRGLIQQFRNAERPIPLDYARLADDLTALQSPAKVAGVLLRWGRDYHRKQTPQSGHSGSTVPDLVNESTQEADQ